MLIDTHCHIHESYKLSIEEVLERSHSAGVDTIICVGTDEESSEKAVSFAALHKGAYAAIGVHPHESEKGWARVASLAQKNAKTSQLVAVGEIGLDYFYMHSPREVQQRALREQIEIALKYDLPIIFHVRDAFDDFWPIFDSYKGIRGVLHSFTDSKENINKALERGLFIGVNGISTFTKDPEQQATFDAIPLDAILFETDAPFLTPTPYRGKINEPAYVRVVAEYHAHRRGVSLEEIAAASSRNARALFGFDK